MEMWLFIVVCAYYTGTYLQHCEHHNYYWLLGFEPLCFWTKVLHNTIVLANDMNWHCHYYWVSDRCVLNQVILRCTADRANQGACTATRWRVNWRAPHYTAAQLIPQFKNLLISKQHHNTMPNHMCTLKQWAPKMQLQNGIPNKKTKTRNTYNTCAFFLSFFYFYFFELWIVT